MAKFDIRWQSARTKGAIGVNHHCGGGMKVEAKTTKEAIVKASDTYDHIHGIVCRWDLVEFDENALWLLLSNDARLQATMIKCPSWGAFQSFAMSTALCTSEQMEYCRSFVLDEIKDGLR